MRRRQFKSTQGMPVVLWSVKRSILGGLDRCGKELIDCLALADEARGLYMHAGRLVKSQTGGRWVFHATRGDMEPMEAASLPQAKRAIERHLQSAAAAAGIGDRGKWRAGSSPAA